VKYLVPIIDPAQENLTTFRYRDEC